MKFENLDKLLQQFLKLVVEKNPQKYANPEKFEDDLGMLSEKFEETSNPSLGGKTPKEYVKALVDEKQLFDYVTYCLENDIEVADIVCDEVIRADDAVEFLNDLLYEKNPDANMLGALLLAERGGADVDDIFIKVVGNSQMRDEVVTVSYEYLSEGSDGVPDKILNIIQEVPAENQGIYVEILSNFKGRKEVFFWLVTMLQRAEDVPLYADLLGSYGDVLAIDILKSFAAENDINYLEYVEIRNAVEELGGEIDTDKDFSADPYYQYMNNTAEPEKTENQ